MLRDTCNESLVTVQRRRIILNWCFLLLFLDPARRPGYEIDHSLPYSAIFNEWMRTSTPLILFHGVPRDTVPFSLHSLKVLHLGSNTATA